MLRRSRTHRRSRPITQEEYEQLRSCRCRRLDGVHLAGHCGSGAEVAGSLGFVSAR
jgi:hypothetical protein